jgi:hypothetical protein
VLHFGDAMYRHCWIHVARNCEANKGWGKCPKSLLFQLAGATTQEEETVILRELRKVHSHVHGYVMSTNRSRWIARYNVGKMDHLLICSNAVEIHNSAAKRVSDLLVIHVCLQHVCVQISHAESAIVRSSSSHAATIYRPDYQARAPASEHVHQRKCIDHQARSLSDSLLHRAVPNLEDDCERVYSIAPKNA